MPRGILPTSTHTDGPISDRAVIHMIVNIDIEVFMKAHGEFHLSVNIGTCKHTSQIGVTDSLLRKYAV